MGKKNKQAARNAASSGASVKKIMSAGNVSRQAAKRIQAKATASAAASTGNFSSAQAKDLRKAGVNSAKIASFRNTSNQYNAAANATTGNQNVNTAIDNQFNGGNTIGRDFYNTPGFQDVLNQNLNPDGSRMTEAQVAKYAMDKGYGLGDAYMAEFGTTTRPRKAKNIRQAIKIAASNDPQNLVSRKEGKGIYNDYAKKKGLDSLKFTGILDKMNSNFDKKGRQQIGLQGNMMNLLASGKLGDRGFSPYSHVMPMIKGQRQPAPDPVYGGLSGILRNMGVTGKFAKGDTLYGQYSTGQFKDSPGAGRTWNASKWASPETTTYKPFAEPTGIEDPGAGGTTNVDPNPTDLPPEEPITPDTNQFGAGSDISSFATSWKSRKSLRQRAGRAAQGFASQRTSPANVMGIGTNYG